MSQNEISCMIPLYNVENYIERCLLSVFSNTIANKVEFILVDDCSSDNSLQIAQNVAKLFPDLNIRFISHDSNKGIAAARNTFLDNANCNFISFVDSDDHVEKDYFEKLLALIKSQEDVDLAFMGYDSTIDDGFKSDCSKFTGDVFFDLVSDNIRGFLWQKIFKREIIERYNIRFEKDLNMFEDVIFCIKYFSHIRNYKWSEDIIYHYEPRVDSYTKKKVTVSDIQKRIMVFECCYNYLKDENLLDGKIKDAFFLRILKFKVCSIYSSNLPIQYNFCSWFPDSFGYYDEESFQFSKITLIALKINPKHKGVLLCVLVLNSIIQILKGKKNIKEYLFNL